MNLGSHSALGYFNSHFLDLKKKKKKGRENEKKTRALNEDISLSKMPLA